MPLAALAGPDCSRTVTLPDYKTIGIWMW